jgi:glycosyltransferase involved in cell wall biosynthesis
MSFPKILIIGQPFNNFSGGGITLSNLFKGWPRDKIAVAYTGHGLYSVTTDICNTIYQLGEEEHRWVFPFSLIQRKFPSGIKSINENIGDTIYYVQTGIRYKIVNRLFYPFLNWLGLIHCLSKIKLSEKFKSWLVEFQPEIIYFQVSTREEILFASDICDSFKIPSVIHMMDDWPSTISNNGIFKKFWHKKIDFEFKKLLDQLDLHLSISDAMSDEYLTRYNKKFVAFHNPIETDVWLPFSKSTFDLDKEYIKILYSGRIGIGITESLMEVASAIDSINDNGKKIKLYIQTHTQASEIINPLLRFNCIVINPFVAYKQLPMIFSEADILLLPNEFSNKGVDFLKFSMPTKASEYMISGTPILIYAPEVSAISIFFKKNECGYCVTMQDPSAIVKGIMDIISNKEDRIKFSQNAVDLAKRKFSANKIREEFQGLLIGLCEKFK